MKRSAFLVLLLTACGGTEDTTTCGMATVNDGYAYGSLALIRDGGATSSPHGVSLDSDRIEVEIDLMHIVFEVPPRLGTYALADLDAELCWSHSNRCEPLEGSLEVTGSQTRSFDGTIIIDGRQAIRGGVVIEGSARIVYAEHDEEYCSTTSGGGAGCGGRPGNGSMLN